jgi:hypothetical protein
MTSYITANENGGRQGPLISLAEGRLYAAELLAGPLSDALEITPPFVSNYLMSDRVRRQDFEPLRARHDGPRDSGSFDRALRDRRLADISLITDAVLDEVREWQNRPLEPVYPIVFFDALRVFATKASLRTGNHRLRRRSCSIITNVM